MEDTYRVRVHLVGFDKERVPELKERLKIYNPKKGSAYFKKILRSAFEGERPIVYETNNDTDAYRMAQALTRAGAHLEVEGLEEEEAAF